MTDKIWLKNYSAGVPSEINPNAYASLVDLFTQSCRKFASLSAVYHFGTSLTYRQLEELSGHFAAYLQQELQLKKGDRFAIVLPNAIQYYVALFGALRAGLVVVNVNPQYTVPELTHQLQDAGAVAVLVMANFADTLAAALPSLPAVKHVMITELGDLLGPIKSSLFNFIIRYVKKKIPPYHIPQAISFRHSLNRGKKLKLQELSITQADTAFLQYTGGTTGTPKGAVLSHGNMVANVMQAVAWIHAEPLDHEREVIMVPLPLYHIFSLTACALCFLEKGGLACLITDPRDLAYLTRQFKRVKCNIFVGINTLFNGLLHFPAFQKINFSHLKLVIGGGMPVQKSVGLAWQQLTGRPIIEGYGLTEASPIVTINPLNITTFTGSIGLPVPSTDVRVCDEADQEVVLGEKGELWVKGPQVMQAYWQNPQETAQVLTPDGWLRTGDIVTMNDQGFLYLVDRKKDMVLVSGFNVYPSEVEAVLDAHPGILEAAVMSVPSEITGEAVKAFVVKKDPSLTAEQIIDYCHGQLVHYKTPKLIEFVAELPKSNVGKVLHRELRSNQPCSSS